MTTTDATTNHVFSWELWTDTDIETGETSRPRLLVSSACRGLDASYRSAMGEAVRYATYRGYTIWAQCEVIPCWC